MAATFATPAKPVLLDQWGMPIDTSKLRQEVAGATMTGIRSVISNRVSDGVTPQRLASILRQAEQGDTVAYAELAEQIEEKDLHYVGVLGTRKRQVAQLEVTVEAAGDDERYQRDADLIRDWLTRDTLQDELFHMLDAVGKGFSLCELIWSMSPTLWWIDRIQWVDPRWVEFDRTDGRTPMLKGDDGLPQRLPSLKFVFTEISAKSGLPVRGGLARPAAWAWMFKNYAVKDWQRFAEIYGMPFRVGKYGPESTNEQREKLLRALRDIGSDAAGMIPASMSIDFVTAAAGTNGNELFAGIASFMNDEISKAVLGQTGTTDAKIGGLGSGDEHGKVREDIERADARTIAAVVGRDIVRPMVDVNHGPPPGGKYPRVVLGRAESWDAVKMMPAIQTFVELGGRVGMSTIRDRLGIPDPGTEEQVLQPAAPKNAPGGPSGVPTPTTPAGSPRPAFLDPLNRPTGPAAINSEAPNGGRDAIDRRIEADLADWEQLMQPLLTPVEQLAANCANLGELQARLGEALADMDPTAFRELIEKSGFGALVAGRLEVDQA